MPFPEKPTDANILKFQTDVESIVVANITKARETAIQSALAIAKKVEDIPKLVKISGAVNQGLDFAWKQGMYGGAKHCEAELQKQARSKGSLNFSLSYGINDVINFTVIDDMKDSSERAYNKRLKDAWRKRDEAEKEKNRLTQRITRDMDGVEPFKDPLDVASNYLAIAQQREVYNTLNNRYSAIAPSSYFSTTYLEKRRSTMSTITEQAVQEEIKKEIAAYVKTRPNNISSRALVKELAVMYSNKNPTSYSLVKNRLTSKQEDLREKVTRKDLLDMEREVDFNPKVSKLADYLEEDERILEEAIKRGDSKAEIKEIRDDLAKTREQYEQAREDATPEKFKARATKRVRREIDKKERSLERVLAKEEKPLESLKEEGKAARRAFEAKQNEYDSVEEELNKLKDINPKRRELLDKGEITSKNLNRRERKILEKRDTKLRQLESKRKELNEVRLDRDRKQKTLTKQQEKVASLSKTLDDGDFGVPLPSKGKTVNLTPDEKKSLTKLLDLESPGALKDLDKDLSITDLEKLKDRVDRKSKVFSDENSVFNAKRLATTEVSAAYNIGRLQVFLTQGIEYVQWISTLDANTSVFCQSLHKKVFALQDVMEHIMWVQQFPKTKEPEYSPRNKVISPRGVWVPPAHPFCRSYFQPVYLRRDEDKLESDIKDKNLRDISLTEKKLKARGKDKTVLGVLKNQAKKRDKKSQGYLRSLDLTGKLYKAGVAAILARFAEEGLASYSDELLDEERVFEDDRALVSVLLGGTVALGAASMMYFFLKGNLSSSLKKTSQSALRAGARDTKNFVGAISRKEAAKMTSDIVDRIQGMGPATKGRFTRPEEDKMALLRERNIKPLVSRGKDAYALAMNDLSMDEVAESLLSNNQLTTDAGKAYVDRLYRDLMGEMRTEANVLNRNSLDILSKSFGNIGVGLDASNIKDIQVWQNGTANVIFKKGKPMLVSGKKLQKALSSNGFRKEVIDTSREAKRMRRVLSEIQDRLDPDDLVTRSRITREMRKLNRLVSLERLPQLKMTPVVRELADDMDDIFKQDIIKQQDFVEVQSSFNSFSDASKEVLDRFRRNLPPEAIMSLDPKKVTDLDELKTFLSEVNRGLERVEGTFLRKSGKSYAPGKIEDLVDMSSTLQNLENVSQKLEGTSVNINYRSTIGRINKVVAEEMSQDYNFLLKQKMDISKRIREIKNDV